MSDSRDPILRRTLLITEAAKLMGVSRRTVYYRLRDGQLESVKARGGSRRVVVTSLECLRRLGLRKNAAVRRPGSGHGKSLGDPGSESET